MTLNTWTSSGSANAGFVHRGKGTYQLSAPNAALASGADGVEFEIDGIADVMFRKARVELTGSNPRGAALTASDVADAANEGALDVIETYNRSTNTSASITGPSGPRTLAIVTDAAYEPIESIS
jgi:hypothetical protein